MGKFEVLFVLSLTIYSAYILFTVFSDEDVPIVPDDLYFGPAGQEASKDETAIRPFKIVMDDKAIEDLKARLKLELSGGRLSPPLEGRAFEDGFNTKELKKIGDYWLNKYDIKERIKGLNKYPQFKTKIAGLDIHFIHIKSTNNDKYKKTRPLLMLHGWPGSFVEFQRALPFLIDPKSSDINFEIVVPSLPGYGFSDASSKPGLGTIEMGTLFLKLMKRLGHEKFYVQGGDWGFVVATHMASIYHRNVMGLHVNSCISFHKRAYLRMLLASFLPSSLIPGAEIDRTFPFLSFALLQLRESGYWHLQATKPNTIGAALSNTPIGLAGYILEKFSTWTDPEYVHKDDGGLSQYKLDDLLDNVMVYWMTNSITSSQRLYKEHFQNSAIYRLDNLPTYVPMGCLSLKKDIHTYGEFLLADKFPQMIQYTTVDTGGHFAAFELPEPFAKDVIKFFNKVEKIGLALFDKKL